MYGCQPFPYPMAFPTYPPQTPVKVKKQSVKQMIKSWNEFQDFMEQQKKAEEAKKGKPPGGDKKPDKPRFSNFEVALFMLMISPLTGQGVLWLFAMANHSMTQTITNIAK